MIKRVLLIYLLFSSFLNNGQEIYVVNNVNDIQIVNVEDLTVTYLFTVPIVEAGYITDLAFAPDGVLYGVTNIWTLLEIDLDTYTFKTIANLPIGDSYTALVCNNNYELFTSKFLSQELYKYNLQTQETSFVANNISTPGDYTFYKGNLVYPGFLNDFIKSYDGINIKDIGCSVSLLWTFVNHFEDCETNSIYAFDESAKLYSYDLETKNYELIADLVSETGPLYGGATTTEYLASACPLQTLETVDCIMNTTSFNPYGISLKRNPVKDFIQLEIKNREPFNFIIYSMIGEMLTTGQVKNNLIPIEKLATGLYFLKLLNPDGLAIFQEKIIKN